MRVVPAYAISAALAISSASAAYADAPEGSIWGDAVTEIDAGNQTQNPSATISATELAMSGGDTQGAPANTRPRDCTVRSWNDDSLSAAVPVRDQLAAVERMTAGERYYVECTWLDTNTTDYAEVFTYQPGEGGPRLDAIARRVYDEVPLVFPKPATSPAIGIDQITGLPTWLWIDAAGFDTFEAQATLAGITVTVTATPKHVAWDLGDGTAPVICAGPGTPYDPTVDDDAQTTDCSHVYQYDSADRPDGVYHASATTTWAVSWTASGGWGGGDLPDATRTTTFDLTAAERQAVVTYNP